MPSRVYKEVYNTQHASHGCITGYTTPSMPPYVCNRVYYTQHASLGVYNSVYPPSMPPYVHNSVYHTQHASLSPSRDIPVSLLVFVLRAFCSGFNAGLGRVYLSWVVKVE